MNNRVPAPRPPGQEEQQGKEPPPPQELANFGLSGKLAKDQNTGNVYKGVVLKVSERERENPRAGLILCRPRRRAVPVLRGGCVASVNARSPIARGASE